tara:strand:- start:341 stop:547 length:207 start_codon:yes stop_codon:yes gene_type:complete
MTRYKDTLIGKQEEFYDGVIDKVAKVEDKEELKTFATDLNRKLDLDLSDHHIDQTISFHWNEYWSKYN